MNRLKYLIIASLLILIFFIAKTYIFFPIDVLQNIPSFSESEWEKPKNSLLADPVYQFEPWRHKVKQEILNGRFPLWNDLNSHGVPLFANFQSAVLYPLNFIYYLLPETMALFLIPLIKMTILTLGTYFYLKILGLRKDISIISSCAVALSGFSITWLLWPHTNVFIFFPWVLFLTEKAISSRNNYRFFLSISILYMISVFGGHPETLAHVILLHLIYTFFKFYKAIIFSIKIVLSIILGIILGGVQILPFLEYLINSSVLKERSGHTSEFFLPVQSFVLNIFPFIFGAPHREIYRPISSSTNFQEAIGGYVGIIVLISSLYFFFKSKNSIVKFWGIVALSVWLISYNIWPFSLFSQMPFLSLSANHRLIAFSGFGLIVIFSYLLQSLLENKKTSSSPLISKNLIVLSTVVCCFVLVLTYNAPVHEWRLSQFVTTIRLPLFLTLISSLFFLYSLNIKKYLIISSAVLVLSQGFAFFHDYNPIINKTHYYPNTNLVSILNNLPKGTYLEVGNPALPANINLMYGFRNIQNYDAIDIYKFKNEFNRAFPHKNSWKNPDDLTLKSLQDFNIDYVISDFDLNLTRQSVQDAENIILPELTKDSSITIEFSPKFSDLRQLRLKSATFNRVNNCLLSIEIIDRSSSPIFSSSINCKELRNNMFFVIPANLKLNTDESYILKIKSESNINNSVTFYGNNRKEPFLQLLFSTPKPKIYKLLGKNEYSSVYEVPKKAKDLDSNNYLIFNNPVKSIYLIELNKGKSFTINRTLYPGWKAKINGKAVKLGNHGALIKIDIQKGTNYVVIEYFPISFFVGLAISSITLILVVIYTMRREYISNLLLINKIRTNLAAKLNKIPFWKKIVIFTISLLLSTITYISLVNFFSPHFSLPWTDVINWYTVNNYPKQQDYFYLITGFPFILIISLLLWILWLTKKR